MNDNANKLVLLIEDDPADRGAPHVNGGRPRQLEYACTCSIQDGSPHLEVCAVRDVNTHETITDTDQLPPIRAAMEAARLYDWSWANRQVFEPGIPMVNGAVLRARKPRPEGPRKPRTRKPKPESPDDEGVNV